MAYGIHAEPDQFERGYNFCVSQKATDSLALIFAKKFSGMGQTDFAEGCTHYALVYKVAKLDNKERGWIPRHENGSTCRLITHNVNHSICEGCKNWGRTITREPYNYSPEQLDFALNVNAMMCGEEFS